eukprot:CAMPEP_0197438788 /NCGR_PEP_ID=MMETSP1175-20131217/5684_1 /TAXON_ID=1003142 /ORGANISM="Triceratium dubium, Strain CCMP147" /LENGTH=545 /DNA_ID=CAMNT_0042968585 /DNA_START=236 /DNA_END=1873 /DNA_ORIENTATION=-
MKNFTGFFAAAALVPPLLPMPWTADAYAIHDVHRRDICGVWKLTSKKSFLPRIEDPRIRAKARPMKEFTVYPKKKKKRHDDVAIEEEEVLLMLSDDGSFMQYGAISPSDLTDDEDEDEEEEKLKPKFGVVRKKREIEEESKRKSVMGLGIIKGTWDFLDGKLILAADRPEDVNDIRTVRDTMLVGDVVVKEEESLADNPALAKSSEGEGKSGSSAGEKKASSHSDDVKDSGEKQSDGGGSIDVHLSVPAGSVEIGKFMYPKKHPSFFEQPMFKPVPTGSFQLRQVLGTLNTRTDDEEEEIEKFLPEDLMGKRYFLTSYPIQRKRRGKKRWSIKYNKFVEDVKEKSDEEKKREESMPVPIRTMELELFPNMTFSTFAGFGSAKILRGKWSVIGSEKDQFWMQIFRFGFGRSVSGSTYSEGMGLTSDDVKAYWGRITEIGKGSGDEESDCEESKSKDLSSSEEAKAKTVEINGSVLDGWGLEPTTVAWFTMIEKTEDMFEEDQDDDDEEEDFDTDLYFLERSTSDADSSSEDSDEEDDFFSSPDAFQ